MWRHLKKVCVLHVKIRLKICKLVLVECVKKVKRLCFYLSDKLCVLNWTKISATGIHNQTSPLTTASPPPNHPLNCQFQIRRTASPWNHTNWNSSLLSLSQKRYNSTMRVTLTFSVRTFHTTLNTKNHIHTI